MSVARPAPRPPGEAGARAARRRRRHRRLRRRCSSSSRRRCSRGSWPARSTAASLGDVAPELVAARSASSRRAAVLAWGFEVAGRRAAATVLSDLGSTLAERRLAPQPAALDGVEAAEVAVASVAGSRSARGLLRPLPPAGRARVPRAGRRARLGRGDRPHLGARHARHAPARAGVHVADRPLHARSGRRERWEALRLLSTHYLDVVRGLPTLRAFNRSRAQAASIAEVSERTGGRR